MKKVWQTDRSVLRDPWSRLKTNCWDIWNKTLRWRHNGRDSVSNHQPHNWLLNRLFRRRWKKTPKLRVTGLYAGNSPGTGEFPPQMTSNSVMFPFDDVTMIQHFSFTKYIYNPIWEFSTILFRPQESEIRNSVFPTLICWCQMNNGYCNTFGDGKWLL